MPLQFLGERRNMRIYPWYVADLVVTKDIEKLLKMRVKRGLALFENDTVRIYYDADSINACGEKLMEIIIRDHQYFKRVIASLKKCEKKLLTYCQKAKAWDLSKVSDEKLFKLLEKYFVYLREMRTWGWVPVFLDGLLKNHLTDKINEELVKHLETIGRHEGISRIYSLLSSATKASEVQTEERARLKLLIGIKKKYPRALRTLAKEKSIFSLPRDSQRKIEKHVKNYGWLTYAYIGPQMSVEYFIGLAIQNLALRNTLEKQLKNLNDHYGDVRESQKRMNEKLHIPKGLVYLFKVSQELMYIKDHRKGVYQKSYVFMEPVTREISKRMGISLRAFQYLILDEVKKGLLEGNNYREITDQRQKKCGYIAENGVISVYQGEKLSQVLQQMGIVKESPMEKNITEIKGMTAYSGMARGVVRIVLVKEDIAKVSEGDILVSSATNPDLLPAMKRAGAFVTDFGGITSHAAIVSREMMKPCVVGTKIATKVLKDGDIILVNANTGYIYVEKRA